MSLELRQKLVEHENTIFRSQLQREDLLSLDRTNTNLIALLWDVIVLKNQPFVFTAIRSDHHDDSCLGEHSHADGDAVDGWFLASPRDGDYLDANDPRFLAAVKSVAEDPYEYQVGLGGSAYTAAVIKSAGPSAFEDNGSDHVHIGAKLPDEV